MSRELHALETKGGRGLLRGGGRSKPERTSILATVARGVLSARAGQLNRRVDKQAGQYNHMRSTIGLLQRRATTDANPNRRRMARVALYGSSGAANTLGRAGKRLKNSYRKLERTERSLRHFGG